MIYGIGEKDLPRHMLEKNGNIYVQSHKNDGKPELEDRIMVSRKNPTLQKTTSINDGIMARQNANRDNADEDARQPNDTPKTLQRKANAAKKTATEVEAAKPMHPRTSDRETRRNKIPTETTVCKENRKDRNNTVRS